MRVVLALDGDGYHVVLACQPGLLDARDPGGSGDVGADDAPLVGGVQPSRCQVAAGSGFVSERATWPLRRRRFECGGGRHA